MTTYIALLRGINVGGYRPLKMEDLREMFTLLGYENVATYIQSGNVVFEAPDSGETLLAEKIHRQIQETFEYDVPVIIRTVPQVEDILKQFPFAKTEGWRGYVSFLPDEPDKDQKQALEARSSEIEKFEIQGRQVYSLVDKQTQQRPLFSNSFIEKQLNLAATTRNLRTIGRILKLAND